MLKEIKDPTLSVETDDIKLIDALYAAKTKSQFFDNKYERCYKKMNDKKFAGHGSCLGFLDKRRETMCSNCWHYISIY